MTEQIFTGNKGAVCSSSCWNFDSVAVACECFSKSANPLNRGKPTLYANPSAYFDAGIPFYLKSTYLAQKVAANQMCGRVNKNQWDNMHAKGDYADEFTGEVMGWYSGTNCLDWTVVSGVKFDLYESWACLFYNEGNLPVYMVHDTSPLSALFSFVRYYDPAVYGDVPVILLYANVSNRGAAGNAHYGRCFPSKDWGYLMFSPNNPSGGAGGGKMQIVTLEVAVSNRVQFGVVLNKKYVQYDPFTQSQDIKTTGPDVLLSYMDSTRVEPQPVCMIPTNSGWSKDAFGVNWAAYQDAAGRQDIYDDNEALQFGLFNSYAASNYDQGFNRNFCYTAQFFSSNLVAQNAFDTTTMALVTPVNRNNVVMSSCLFQMVVNDEAISKPAVMRSAFATSFNPAGSHTLINLSAQTVVCRFSNPTNGTYTSPLTGGSYDTAYSYTMRNEFTKEVAVPPNGGAKTVNNKLTYDSGLPGGAIEISSNNMASGGSVMYGDRLNICQSRRLPGGTPLAWFFREDEPLVLYNISTAQARPESSVVLGHTDRMCWTSSGVFVYRLRTSYETPPMYTSHLVYDLVLKMYNNTYGELTLFGEGLDGTAFPVRTSLDVSVNRRAVGGGDPTRFQLGIPARSDAGKSDFHRVSVSWTIDPVAMTVVLSTNCPFLKFTYSSGLQAYDPVSRRYRVDIDLSFRPDVLVPLVLDAGVFADKLLVPESATTVPTQTVSKATVMNTSLTPPRVVSFGTMFTATLRPDQVYRVDKTTLGLLEIGYSFPVSLTRYVFTGFTEASLASLPLFMVGTCTAGVNTNQARLNRRLLMASKGGENGYQISLDTKAVQNYTGDTLLLTLPDHSDTNGSKLLGFSLPSDTIQYVATSDMPFAILRFP